MELTFEMKDDILIAKLSGELDHHSAAGTREEIDQTMNAFHAGKLILSFDQVTFMDSAGIGVVMGRYNRMRDKGGKLLLAGGNEYIRRILDMAGINTIARHYDTTEEALIAAGKKEEEA